MVLHLSIICGFFLSQATEVEQFQSLSPKKLQLYLDMEKRKVATHACSSETILNGSRMEAGQVTKVTIASTAQIRVNRLYFDLDIHDPPFQ